MNGKMSLQKLSDVIYQGFLKMKDIFTGDLSNNKVIGFAVYVVFISILELLAYRCKGIFSLLASRLWLLGGLFCFVGILLYYIKSISLDWKERKLFPIVTMLFLLMGLCYVLVNLRIFEINPDATQQAAEGINALHRGDWNYTGYAFLGYPARQYIISAIPAAVFGRSILTLHLGFGIPFIMGILCFYSGLHRWAFMKGVNSNLAVLPVLAMFTFPFVTEYYANFEQAIYPISFTMIAIGFFLLTLCKPNLLSLFGLTWIGCMMSTSYTPALASLGLLAAILVLAILTLALLPMRMPLPVKLPQLLSLGYLLVEVNILMFFYATLLDKRQDHFSKLQQGRNLLKTTGKSMVEFLMDKNAKFLGVFAIIVLVYLVASLTLQLRFWDFTIAVWVLGVSVMADILMGYTAYQPAWIMQRALIVIPVLLTGLTLSFFEVVRNHKFKISNKMIAVVAITFALVGAYNFKQPNQSFVYFNYIQPMKYMLQDLEKTTTDHDIASESEFNLVVYTESALLKNIKDYSKFLYPNARIYTPDELQAPDEMSPELATISYGDLGLPKGIQYEEQRMLMFKDKKHNQDIVWYKGIVTLGKQK
jgi:4-amino-4-deoxy-L-arabinose transferase and related glycosyltransferases of PMT family